MSKINRSRQTIEQTDWADLNMKVAIAMTLVIIAALLTYIVFKLAGR